MKSKFSLLWIIVIFIFGSLITTTAGERILVVSFFATYSHVRVYQPLLKELANRGHDITVISPFKLSKPHPKIREIQGIPAEAFKEVNFFNLRLTQNNSIRPTALGPICDPICRETYDLPEVREILLKKEKFDVILLGAFINECAFGFIHKLDAPFILIAPTPIFSTTASFFGAWMPSSFVPLITLGTTDQMNFLERSRNFINNALTTWIFYFQIYPSAEKIYREKLDQHLPSTKEIGRNASLIFINSHYTLNYPRPLMPDMIEVGGMHCQAAEPLPKDLEDYIAAAGEHGVIYFSLGTVVLGHLMPEPIRKMFVNVFSKLKQSVLWKWETETMIDLPTNVKLAKFFPQQDILGLPNIRLFITHGGLLSTEEAVYHGVPLVGLPFFADQDWNMKQSESAGIAITLEVASLTEDQILNAINRILDEPKFAENARSLSATFKDRPIKPLDSAVFWTEYVIRHKGAHHLRSPARDLNDFQYLSLDVISVLIAVLLVAVTMIYFILKYICRRLIAIFEKSEKTSRKKSRNKTE